MPFLKSVELFFRGLGRAGITYRRAKTAERHLATVDRRLDSGEEGIRRLERDLGERLATLEREVERSTSLEQNDRTLDRLARMEQALGLEPRTGRRPVLHRLVRIEETLFESQRGELEAVRAAAGRAESAVAGLRDEVGAARAATGRVEDAQARTAEEVGAMQSRLARAAAEHALLSRAYSDLSRRLDLARFAQGEKPAATLAAGAPEPPEGLEALLDAFYARLEDRFRGSREEIAGRLRAYLPDARAAFERTGGKPALDLGCGRGEWLGVLAEAGLPAEGVDLNPQQTAEAAEAGLAIRQGDALAALAEAPDASLSLVSAHHLIEHLPFERVVSLTREALRALAPGGVLLYETPNVRNLIVGASTFHIDPTHRRPLPAEALSVLFDTVGFHPVELRHLHPSETQEAFLAERRADPAIVSLLFGPQDLAVLGTRPGAG